MQIGIEQAWRLATSRHRSPPRRWPAAVTFPLIVALSAGLWTMIISAFIALG